MTALSLDDAVTQLADLLAREVVLESVEGRLLAYSRHSVDTDRVRTNYLLTKSLPGAVAQWQLANGVARAVKPVVLPPNPELGMLGRVCVPLLTRGHRVGYLWIVQADTGVAAHELLRAIATFRPVIETIAVALLAAALVDSDDVHPDARLFLSACTGDRLALDSLRKKLSGQATQRNTEPWRVVVLVLRPETAARDSQFVTSEFVTRASVTSASVDSAALHRVAMLYAIRGLNGVICCASTERQCVLLVASTVSGPHLVDAARRFAHYVSEQHGRSVFVGLVGVSDDIMNVEQIPKAWDEARHAAQAVWVDRSFGHLALYSSLGVYQFLATVAISRVPAPTTHFSQLLAHDPTRELTHLLELLYDTHGSVAEVADRLHIHRTSVYSRLGRIHEIINADPLRGSVRLELHLALKTLKWAGRPALQID